MKDRRKGKDEGRRNGGIVPSRLEFCRWRIVNRRVSRHVAVKVKVEVEVKVKVEVEVEVEVEVQVKAEIKMKVQVQVQVMAKGR